MSDTRYRPQAKPIYMAWALFRAVPPVVWLSLMWLAACDQRYRPAPDVAALMFCMLITYYAVLRMRRNKRSARVAAAHAATSALLVNGNLEAGAASIDGVLEDVRHTPPVHCIMLVQRAQLFLRLGDADRALAILEAVRDSHWLDDKRLAQGASSLASAFAMTQLARGDLDEAERWAKEAHAKIREKERVQLVLIDALVDARRARYAEAARRIDAGWKEAEKALAPRALDLLRFVRAFVADALGEKARPPGDVDVADLIGAWPEMRAFAAKRAKS